VISLDDRGFTLVEAVSAVLILSIVLAVIVDLYVRGVILWNRGEKRIEVQDNIRIGLDRVSRELRQARRLTSNTTSRATPNDVLEFVGHDGAVVRYEVSGTVLRRRSGYGNFEPLSNHIKESGGLQVEWYPSGQGGQAGATRVKVTLSGCSGTTGEYSLATSITFRQQ